MELPIFVYLQLCSFSSKGTQWTFAPVNNVPRHFQIFHREAPVSGTNQLYSFVWITNHLRYYKPNSSMRETDLMRVPKTQRSLTLRVELVIISESLTTLCFSRHLCVFLSTSIFLWVFLSQSLTLCLCVSLSIFLHLCVSASLYLSLYLCVSPSIFLFISLRLCLS